MTRPPSRVFDVPIDGWYAWLGVAAVSVLALGLTTTLPSTPPPQAAPAAEAIDRTAASDYDATAEIPVDARQVRLGRHQVGLRNDAGSTHASLSYGPVISARSDPRLEAVLYGESPSRAFESAAAFEAAVEATRDEEPNWKPIEGPILVRRVFWRGVDVTLVG